MQFDTNKAKQRLNDHLYTVGEKATAHANELAQEQISHPDKANPTSNVLRLESTRPGQLLNQDILFVGAIEGIGKVYLYAVVDTFSGLAFGAVDTTQQSETAVAVLHNSVLPYFAQRHLKVKSILTNRGQEFCSQQYKLYLTLNEIDHRYMVVKLTQAKGSSEVFHAVVFNEFFARVLTNIYEGIKALQVDLDQWLGYYNTVHLNHRYSSSGQSPVNILNYYLDGKG